MIISDLVLLIMNKLFSVLIVTILLLQLTVAQRISEKKCREYSEIRSTKLYPHMVWIREANKEISSFGPTMGVLISDQYILTSSLSDIIVHKSKAYFTEDEEINIIERHTHPLYNGTAHHDIALLKLEHKVKLDGDHRPACLWTNEKIDETEVFLMKLLMQMDNKYDFSPTTEHLLTESVCGGLIYEYNIPLLCTHPLKTKDIDDSEYEPVRGSPIQVKKTGLCIQNNQYIIGIYSRHGFQKKRLNVGPKISLYLDWIEDIVWPPRNKDCGKVKVQVRGLISFGYPTYHGEFPWHVALHRRGGLGLRQYICGGSVLNEKTVLTAAHCVKDENGITAPNLLIVSLGTYDLDFKNEDSREVRVSEIILHENFTLNYYENDIALLKLSHLIPFSKYIEPICFTEDSSIFSTEIGVAAGWGRNEQHNLQSLLSKASLPIVSNDDCRNSNRGFFPTYINDRNFCAGYGNGTNVCSGDSGGGLVFESGGNWYVRGIVSLAAALPTEKICDITQLVLFTDVTKYYDWIVDRL